VGWVLLLLLVFFRMHLFSLHGVAVPCFRCA
jgi:hypothetical protein